jgi:EAL domain-containing protein (putative c-di-GMP-specific phosphodiesterase class I)
MFIQPQVDASGKLVGADTLMRWQHPTRGLLPPGMFIPIAEQSDLIVELGAWIMTQACKLLTEESGKGRDFRISVNVSPRHFRKGNFVSWLKGLVTRYGVDVSRLTLEITESLFIDNFNDVIAKMTELVALGVHFSIDDFGTGYSSLAYLKRLPIDELKIDKSFVQDAPTDSNDAALVETILAVAQHLNLKIVAEGVETGAQADFLNARGSVIHQGYYYGRPEPPEKCLGKWKIY